MTVFLCVFTVLVGRIGEMSTNPPVATVEERPTEIAFDPTPFLSEDALDSLQYLDGQTTEEVAEGFKKQGNEAFNKGKKFYKSAENYYTKAIRQPNVPAKNRSVYFSNRAAVQIEQGSLFWCCQISVEYV